jgi:uncharacterized protein
MQTALILAITALWIGLVKGGLGGPVGSTLVLPLLVQIMPAQQAVGIVLPLLMVGDIAALRAYWRDWDMGLIRRLLPAAILGVVAGTLLLAALPEAELRRTLGVLMLLLVVYKIGSDVLRQVQYEPRPWHGSLAGFVAGSMSALANAGGPPMTAYLLLQKLQPTAFVGTMTLFFTIINILKIPAFLSAQIINLPLLLSVAWIVLLIPAGVVAGRWIIVRINRHLFDQLMTVLLVLAALLLLFGT